jgi:hypothetical protein
MDKCKIMRELWLAVVWSARVFFDPTQQFLTELAWRALLGGAWL